MGLMLSANGKLMTRNGKLFVDTNGTDCCCDEPGCACSDKCDSPFYRVTIGASGLVDPGDPWEIVAVYNGNFTEGDAGSIPPPEVCCSPITRYWTATFDNDCTSSGTTFLELACCNVSEGGTENSRLYLRINSNTWFAPTNATCADYAGSQALGLDDVTCTGTPHIEVWCTETPPALTGDLNVPDTICD